MPEGHKTHRIALDHTQWFGGQIVKVTSPQGRFRTDARKVSGRVLLRVEAVGKQVFYHFEGDRIVQIHLGRYGGIKLHDSPPPKPVGQIRMRCVGDNRTFDLSGPTTCRVIDDIIREEVIAKLGPDPLGGGKKHDVWTNIQSSKKPIGALLLDQSVVAGVGNIFRAEMLFEARLHPSIPGTEMTRPEFDRLWKSLLRQMKVGLKHGKIISVTSKEAGMPLSKVDGKDRFRVYGNEYCPVCAAEIRQEEIGGRRLYFCQPCQER